MARIAKTIRIIQQKINVFCDISVLKVEVSIIPMPRRPHPLQGGEELASPSSLVRNVLNNYFRRGDVCFRIFLVRDRYKEKTEAETQDRNRSKILSCGKFGSERKLHRASLFFVGIRTQLCSRCGIRSQTFLQRINHSFYSLISRELIGARKILL